MALSDRIAQDNTRIFMNAGHFAEEHTWNGIPFSCVPDEEAALKRKNNNVVDLIIVLFLYNDQIINMQFRLHTS